MAKDGYVYGAAGELSDSARVGFWCRVGFELRFEASIEFKVNNCDRRRGSAVEVKAGSNLGTVEWSTE